MGRRLNDPSIPASETLTLRLSAADRDLLDRLVAARAVELEGEGVEVTAASYVRGLIRKEAKARGLEPITPTIASPSPPVPAGKAVKAKTASKALARKR